MFLCPSLLLLLILLLKTFCKTDNLHNLVFHIFFFYILKKSSEFWKIYLNAKEHFLILFDLSIFYHHYLLLLHHFLFHVFILYVCILYIQKHSFWWCKMFSNFHAILHIFQLVKIITSVNYPSSTYFFLSPWIYTV